MERDSEQMQWKNTQIINKQLQGKRIPEISEVIEKLRKRYSKYGKRQNDRRLLSKLRFSETVSTKKAEEESERVQG